MRSVTYSMGVSLDGYIVGPDGTFDWTAPDDEVFRFVTRRDPWGRSSPAGTPAVRDDAFSTTLSAVRGNHRLASGGLAEEIERLRAEPGDGDIAIGGAALGAEAAASGLIDEYRARVYPVLVGGAIRFFPRHERRVDLELVETPTFSSRVVYLRYRAAH